MAHATRFIAAALALALLQVLWSAPPAHAAETPAQRLAKTYSPIMQFRTQEEDPPCDTRAEQYAPTTVFTVLGNPMVALVKATKKRSRRITTAPTQGEIAGRGHDYYLDLPG